MQTSVVLFPQTSEQTASQKLEDLKVKIYADGADKAGMTKLAALPLIKGLTTNPTLMRSAGLTDYEFFAREVLAEIHDKPISFEVFSDDFPEMKRQALKINRWQENVYVKIPVTNTLGQASFDLIAELAKEGVKLNITALLTERQVEGVIRSLQPNVPSIISVFAGRIADTGRNPMAFMKQCASCMGIVPGAELLWASVREVLNIYQADEVGCDIVTVPHEILKKALKMAGQDLTDLSLETVKLFANDAAAAGFKL